MSWNLLQMENNAQQLQEKLDPLSSEAICTERNM
jgi:hypothetical protein